MEPFSIMAMTAIGLGLQAFGMNKKEHAGEDYNRAQVAEIQAEQQIESQKQRVMELDANRRSIENVREAQRARAIALATGVGKGQSGMGLGSGVEGAFGGIAGQAGWNSENISNKLEIGRNVFGINSMISGYKVQMANAQKDIGDAQGYSDLGKSLVGSAPAFGRLTSGFGGNGSANGPSAGAFGMTGTNWLG